MGNRENFLHGMIKDACRELGTYTCAEVMAKIQDRKTGNGHAIRTIPTMRQVMLIISRNGYSEKVKVYTNPNGGTIIKYRYTGA